MKPTAAVLATLILAGCYGKATPESCHKKYVVNGRGDDVHDTYQACLARADARAAGLPENMADLHERVVFETGCPTVRLVKLQRTGKAITRVGAEACGRRLVYARTLGRSTLGIRTARESEWEIVADSDPRTPVAVPAVQITNVYAPGAATPNPYAEPAQ